MKIELEYKTEKSELHKYVWEQSYEEFKKFLNNFIVNSYNEKEYNKAEVWKELLQHLYYLEVKKWKFSWQ